MKAESAYIELRRRRQLVLPCCRLERGNTATETHTLLVQKGSVLPMARSCPVVMRDSDDRGRLNVPKPRLYFVYR